MADTVREESETIIGEPEQLGIECVAAPTIAKDASPASAAWQKAHGELIHLWRSADCTNDATNTWNESKWAKEAFDIVYNALTQTCEESPPGGSGAQKTVAAHASAEKDAFEATMRKMWSHRKDPFLRECNDVEPQRAYQDTDVEFAWEIWQGSAAAPQVKVLSINDIAKQIHPMISGYTYFKAIDIAKDLAKLGAIRIVEE